MVTKAKPWSQGSDKQGLSRWSNRLGPLNRLSLRMKIVLLVVVVLLVLLVIAIPGDRSELTTRQGSVETTQTAFDSALPAASTAMENVMAFLNEAEVDLSSNRSFTRLASTVTTFTRPTTTPASRFQAAITFSENVHSLVDGTTPVVELDTEEFRMLVAEMDTNFSAAWLALLDLNTAVDSYNGYNSWISAKIASGLFGFPQSYTDPIPSSSRLISNTTLVAQQ